MHGLDWKYLHMHMMAVLGDPILFKWKRYLFNGRAFSQHDATFL